MDARGTVGGNEHGRRLDVQPRRARQLHRNLGDRQQCGRRWHLVRSLRVTLRVSNGFSIADPNDAGMLDVVRFDAAAPQLMADFAAGRL